MIEPGNEKKLYEALAHLLDNPTERAKLAEKAYETVAHCFSYEVWATNWLNLIRNLE